MNNIFEGAKFGDKFLTRDGRIAIYCNTCLNNHHYVLIEGETVCLSVLSNGSCVNNAFDSPDDIVSRYQEPIDEDKLWELSEEYYKNNVEKPKTEKGILDEYSCPYLQAEDIEEAFYEGYLKAMEE